MPINTTIYRIADGHFRVPFAGLSLFIRLEGIAVSTAEARALENVSTFVFSVGILAKRLRGHLDAYSSETWAHVPIYELFLDAQGFFLFVQQSLEDLTLIVRLALPPRDRHQMSPNFSRFKCRLLKSDPDAPFARFLSTEEAWFDEMKDLRDDILHRTLFRERNVFPDLRARLSGR